MSIYNELSNDREFSPIKGIQFTVMSPEEIKARSVCEVVSTDTYSGSEPVVGGLFDTRMGVIEHSKICKTCQQKNTFCPGHFGHIALSKPVYYIQFFDTVVKTLRCVCVHCAKLLVSIDSPRVQAICSKNISRQKRFDMLYKMCSKIKKCGSDNENGCGMKQPDKITKTNEGRIMMTFKLSEEAIEEGMDATGLGADAAKSSKTQAFFAEDALALLSRITDDDANVMGFKKGVMRPEWMICTMFPVPPPTVRPSVRNDTGQRCEDDLTHKLCDIVKTNNSLRKKIERVMASRSNPHEPLVSSDPMLEGYYSLLQYHVFTFVNNQIPNMAKATQRTGRALRSLVERLKGKEGRIRGNLMGKRVDFSARSVITPDANISIDELGVPVKVAMNITFPEVVTPRNMESLTKMIRNGPDVYPGAKYLKRVNEGNRTLRLKTCDRSSIVLYEGDVVERHMVDGDYVLFNRQPSLHKMSMMGHRVRVMPYDTFRLNVCVTASYNADFDGDEMNLHMPQSVQTANELIMLASVPTQIISPREGKPIVAVVQDIALGVSRITQDHVRISPKQYCNLMSNIDAFCGVLPKPMTQKGLSYYTGRQAVSTYLPKTLNARIANKRYGDELSDAEKKRHMVVIRNGELIQGTLDKQVFQNKTKGIVHSVYNENGPTETRSLFDNTQRLICDFLVYDGFSVGISDLMVSAEVQDRIRDRIAKTKTDVYGIIASIHNGSFENKSIYNNLEHFENQVNTKLNDLTSELSKIGLQGIHEENRMLNMVLSGSKGNSINVAQMVAGVGQQNVEGRRITYGFDHRTLPHFTRYDDGPETRGFVENSFVRGLKPHEFFFHAMGGREGLIDTAVKTSSTGYLQRKLVKGMEDCKIAYDGTVRNANGGIVQFLYGDDGINPIKTEKQNIRYIDMTPEDMEREYLIAPSQLFSGYLTKAALKKADGEAWSERLFDHYQTVVEDREFVIKHMLQGAYEKTFSYPVRIEKIVENAARQPTKRKILCDMTPLQVLELVDAACDGLELGGAINPGTGVLARMVRMWLSPKLVIFQHRMNRAMLESTIAAIRERFRDAIAHPSEMVGIVSAQSIGEPCTQLTLNTFHSSGIGAASKGVRGVPRLTELLSVSKNIKTPQLQVFVNDRISSDMKAVTTMKKGIETYLLRDVVSCTQIFFDQNSFQTGIQEDAAMMEYLCDFASVFPECGPNDSPWVLRMVFDKELMYGARVTIDDVHAVIRDIYGDKLRCVYSDSNAAEVVMRIQIDTNKSNLATDLKAIESNLMENVIIKGIPKINKGSVRSVKTMVYNEETRGFENKEEWVIDTDGSNLFDVLGHPMVDSQRTITNNIVEIYEHLGIEATREALLHEIVEVLDDQYVDYHHLSLLVDTMTMKGTLLSIDRHGINRSDIGPLAKCSFEETSDMLVKAGIFAEHDRMNGVSASIMLGQLPPCGTGNSTIRIDTERLPEEPEAAPVIDMVGDVSKCARENMGFNFDMPTGDMRGMFIPVA